MRKKESTNQQVSEWVSEQASQKATTENLKKKNKKKKKKEFFVAPTNNQEKRYRAPIKQRPRTRAASTIRPI